MPIGPARMPLMEHLGELRMRLVRIVVVLLVAVCVFYLASATMGQFLLLPIADFLPKAEDGTVFTNHYWVSPLENPDLVKNNCSQCHSDLAGFVKNIGLLMKNESDNMTYETDIVFIWFETFEVSIRSACIHDFSSNR